MIHYRIVLWLANHFTFDDPHWFTGVVGVQVVDVTR